MICDALNYREEIFVKRALRLLRIFREICRKSGESCEYREYRERMEKRVCLEALTDIYILHL